jgi:hypothetical protein
MISPAVAATRLENAAGRRSAPLDAKTKPESSAMINSTTWFVRRSVSPGVMAAADQQISADFASLNLFRLRSGRARINIPYWGIVMQASFESWISEVVNIKFFGTRVAHCTRKPASPAGRECRANLFGSGVNE